jgi:hypothetical protein
MIPRRDEAVKPIVKSPAGSEACSLGILGIGELVCTCALEERFGGINGISKRTVMSRA